MSVKHGYSHSFSRRSSVRLLVFLLLLCNFGYVFWHSVRTVSYHYVRDHRAGISMRDTIIVSRDEYKGSADLIWVKHDEIRYKGEMFDIKKPLEHGDKMILVGHYDKFENKLFKLLFKWLDDEDNDKPGTQCRGKWLQEAIVMVYYKPSPVLPDVLSTQFFDLRTCDIHSRESVPPFRLPIRFLRSML